MNVKDYMRIAYINAERDSHDNSTRAGAIIIIDQASHISGVNRFTSAKQNNERNLNRERKYPRIVHAERHAIFTAARMGIRLEGKTMVCPWACCPECAQAIVMSGISKVYAHKDALDRTPERWREAIQMGIEILKDGDVEYIPWSGNIGKCVNLFDGEVWYP